MPSTAGIWTGETNKIAGEKVTTRKAYQKGKPREFAQNAYQESKKWYVRYWEWRREAKEREFREWEKKVEARKKREANRYKGAVMNDYRNNENLVEALMRALLGTSTEDFF